MSLLLLSWPCCDDSKEMCGPEWPVKACALFPPHRVWLVLGLSRRALKLQIRKIHYPLFGNEVCSPSGKRQPSCSEEAVCHNTREAHCWGKLNEWDKQCQEAPFDASPLFSSCTLQFFIINFEVCLRALVFIRPWAPNSSLSKRWLIPPSLCRQFLALKGSTETHQQLPHHHLLYHSVSNLLLSSALSKTDFSVTEKMGISPLYCPRDWKGTSDRKSRENWDCSTWSGSYPFL